MKFYLAGLALAMVPNTAMAQEANEAPNKFYAGPVIGVDSFEGDDTEEGETGIVYGALVGYDLLSGRTVLGVEAELLESAIADEEEDVFSAGDRLSLGIGLDLYAGLRAGVRIGASGLLYVKGGYTNLDVNARYEELGGFAVKVTQTYDGYRLGAGAELDLFSNLLARLEYRFSSYDAGDDADAFDGLDIRRHQGVAALLFRF